MSLLLSNLPALPTHAAVLLHLWYASCKGIEIRDVPVSAILHARASLLAFALLLAMLKQAAVTPWERFAPDVHVRVRDLLLLQPKMVWSERQA
jgi:hypothetical protein